MPTRRETPPTVLVLGSRHTSIAITRLLARAGHRVVVERLRHDPSFADRSRLAAEVWEHGSPRRDEAWLDLLTRFLAGRPDVSLVYPVLDDELVLFGRHFDRLPRGVRFVMPSPEVIATCETKIELMQLASKIGVSQTPYALVTEPAELFAEAKRIGFPCVVKPPDALAPLFFKKALIFASEPELRARFAAWPEEHGSLIVQEFARGRRFDVYALAREGQLLAALQTRVLRTDRADGTGVTVEAVTVPLSDALREQCALVLDALKLTGPAYFQLHYDEERGFSHLLEINPRLGVNFNITTVAGWNLPASAVKLALGEPLPASQTGFTYPLGRRYAWSWGDLSGLRRELRFRQIGLRRAARWLVDLAVTFVRADIHVTWSWSDPLPTLAIYASHFLRATAGALRRVVPSSTTPGEPPA